MEIAHLTPLWYFSGQELEVRFFTVYSAESLSESCRPASDGVRLAKLLTEMGTRRGQGVARSVAQGLLP